jgi:hypothetical protein
MFKRISTVLIWSEDYKTLSDWYKNTLGLEVKKQLNHPKDTGVLFQIGDTQLWIGQHSGIKGKNEDAARHMFNLDVDSVEKSYNYLRGKGVKFIAPPFKAPTMDYYFATFLDLDNNMIQLFGAK